MNHESTQSGFPPRAVTRNFKELRHDVASLLKLQLELMRIDLAEWRKQLSAPLLLLGCAAIVGLAAIPVLLISGGHGLAQWTGLPLAAGLAIVAVIALAAAGVAGYLGWRRLQKTNAIFHRSEEELRRNIDWIKELWSDDHAWDHEPDGDRMRQPR